MWLPRAQVHCSPLLSWVEMCCCCCPYRMVMLCICECHVKRNLLLSLKPVRAKKCLGSLLCPQYYPESFQGCWGPCVRETGLKNSANIPFQSFKYYSFFLTKGWFTPWFGTRCRCAKAVEDLSVQLTRSISICRVSCRAGLSFFTSKGQACPDYLSAKEQDV